MSSTKELVTKTWVPALGVTISCAMYMSPLGAVLKADKAGALGVSRAD